MLFSQHAKLLLFRDGNGLETGQGYVKSVRFGEMGAVARSDGTCLGKSLTFSFQKCSYNVLTPEAGSETRVECKALDFAGEEQETCFALVFASTKFRESEVDQRSFFRR